MPFTPYHLGHGSLIGLSLFRIFDFPALLTASVIVDIEPFSVLFFNLNYPLTINPFYNLFSPEQIYLFSGLSFLVAIFIYLAGLLQV